MLCLIERSYSPLWFVSSSGVNLRCALSHRAELISDLLVVACTSSLLQSLLLFNSSLQEIGAIIQQVRTYTTMAVGILAAMAKGKH
jgi:hypothetical protein